MPYQAGVLAYFGCSVIQFPPFPDWELVNACVRKAEECPRLSLVSLPAGFRKHCNASLGTKVCPVMDIGVMFPLTQTYLDPGLLSGQEFNHGLPAGLVGQSHGEFFTV